MLVRRKECLRERRLASVRERAAEVDVGRSFREGRVTVVVV